MAPEYITHSVATPSTDLYALAVVAWEALTGKPLYPGADSMNEVAPCNVRSCHRPPR